MRSVPGALGQGAGCARRGPVVLSRSDVQVMIDHARRESPDEACGVLAGREGCVTAVYPLTNADHSPSSYRLDPGEQYRAFLEIEDRGWEVMGVYHSHTKTAAYPSPTDIRHAYDPEGVYLIVSLADPSEPVLRGFRISGGEVEEIQLAVRED